MGMTEIILLSAIVLVFGYVAYRLLGGPSANKASQRRLQAVRFRHAASTTDKVESQLRKAIASRRPRAHRMAGSGSRVEALSVRLERTGLGWSLSQYLYVSIGIAVVFTVLLFLQTGAALLSLGIGVAAGAGLPHMIVNWMIKRRINGFNAKFADGIDLLVRGLRSGLPVSETFTLVASEIGGPVGKEFRGVVERIKIGRTMEEALQVTADRLGTPEFQFFVITLAIQRETGGNLAETLANLSDVLRKRTQMKLKIKALSSEAKASAYIVGFLPFAVFTMIYWINPEYLGGFFTDDRLIAVGLGGLLWMSIGAFVMAKMVSFEI
ncbi:type II secretion system F family protein [Altericroceibacterium endophyticum]|uniref:Pilus assembly protein TadB n=1 Tax=Altericroceibacterium endophyticum TaxID=1808508 RepID=A0A6I4T9G4_9SPHN|nr:type II secretion system F family protein [Altericroceibacterium endophyticum]MXO66510.1 pilus assembly protein TadB [Altericroceibacterium endophyticum]